MTDGEKEIVAKASVPMTIANGFRLFFMIIALLLALFLFFANKIFQDTAWYGVFVQHAYVFLFWDIMLMFISTIAKVLLTARYNHIVKKL